MAIDAAALFYRRVLQRKIAMAGNAARAHRESGCAGTAFVMGGFHTDHISQLLEDAGLSTLVISPVVKGKRPARYESALLERWSRGRERVAQPLQMEIER